MFRIDYHDPFARCSHNLSMQQQIYCLSMGKQPSKFPIGYPYYLHRQTMSLSFGLLFMYFLPVGYSASGETKKTLTKHSLNRRVLLFIFSCLFNISWILLWHFSYFRLDNCCHA